MRRRGLSVAGAEHSLSVAPDFAPVCGDSPRSLRGEPGISQKPHLLKNETPKGAPPNSKACPASLAGGRPLKPQEALGWPILARFARVGLAFASLFTAGEPASL